MTYFPVKPKCLLVPSGPQVDGKHLYVILTNKCPKNCHLAVSIQTVYPGEYSDPACYLQGGEHRFITHRSFVAYSRLRIWEHDAIIARVTDFTYIQHDDASPDLLQKIYDGIALSKRAAPRYKAYFATTRSI